MTRYSSRREQRYPRRESSFVKGLGAGCGLGCGWMLFTVGVIGTLILLASL